MLHFFPKQLKKLKHNYKHPFIFKIQKHVLRHSVICKQLRYFVKFEYKFHKVPEIQKMITILLNKRDFILDRILNKERIFDIYRRNSTIPKFFIFRKITVHQGRFLKKITFRKRTVINLRFGQYARTQRLGRRIHSNNRIAKKLQKKAKLLAIRALYNRTSKRKRAATKAVKRKRNK